MCLVAAAIGSNTEFPLIIAGNRDELHARDSAPAGWWGERPEIFGGRDLVAGGSWLAVNRRGHVAVVLNYPGRELPAGERASRGALVSDYLSGRRSPREYLGGLQHEAERFAGFCLVLGSRDGIYLMASPSGDAITNRQLPSGVHVASNSLLDQPWPKNFFLQRELAKAIAQAGLRASGILALLQRREPVPAENADAAPEYPAHALTPFVTGSEYGTRASTVVLFDREGNCHFVEHRFNATGRLTGTTDERFLVEG